MIAQIFAVVIFITMFVFIVTEIVERHIVSLISALLTMIFVFGIVFFALNIAILTSGIKGRGAGSYFCTNNETGVIRISSNSIENIALSLSKRFGGVKEAKSKAKFTKQGVEIIVKLTVYPDVNVPSLCKSVQERIKDSVQNTMEIKVRLVDVSVDGVNAVSKTEE